MPSTIELVRLRKVTHMNRRRVGGSVRALTEEEHYLTGLIEIGESVLCLLALTTPHDPQDLGDAKERDDRRFALCMTNKLMKRLPRDGDGADLLVEESLHLWKYDPLTVTVVDDADISSRRGARRKPLTATGKRYRAATPLNVSKPSVQDAETISSMVVAVVSRASTATPEAKSFIVVWKTSVSTRGCQTFRTVPLRFPNLPTHRTFRSR